MQLMQFHVYVSIVFIRSAGKLFLITREYIRFYQMSAFCILQECRGCKDQNENLCINVQFTVINVL